MFVFYRRLATGRILRQQTSQELTPLLLNFSIAWVKVVIIVSQVTGWLSTCSIRSSLLACDEPNTKGPLYVAYGQMINHLKASLRRWSPEGLGYFIYPMSFTGLLRKRRASIW